MLMVNETLLTFMEVTLRVPTPCDLNLAATGTPLKKAFPARTLRPDDDRQGTKHFPASADDMLDYAYNCLCFSGL